MDETNRDVENPNKDEVAPENVGRTGYGMISGNLTTMYGFDVKEANDFPPNISPLEKRNWYNYSLESEFPSPISSSVDVNRRVWQDMEIERMLDHHPTHEVHSSLSGSIFLFYFYCFCQSTKKEF